MAQSKKDTLVSDVNFIIDECARFAFIVSNDFKQISREDVLHTLPHPTGRGQIICGRAAAKKITGLANIAAQQNNLIGRISDSTIRRPIEHLLVKRFMKEKRQVDISQVDRMLAAAAKEARSKVSQITHLVPCHLIAASDPAQLVIGPVTFHNRRNIRTLLLKKLREAQSEDSGYKRELYQRRLLATAIRYYRNFRWVAEVRVPGCDPVTSIEVAKNAVTSALNCIHMLFGFDRTERMQVGGPAIPMDRRAMLTISEGGRIESSLSAAYLGHVEYENGWSKILESEDFRFYFDLCGVALEAAVDLDLKRPLSRRFLDALQWFGEACRENNASTRTIKFMTAVELLLTTGERDEISEMIAIRTANLCSSTHEGRSEWRHKARRAYDFRSRLVHGSMSPRDPETWAGARLAAEVAESVLLRAVQAFGASGLRASDISQRTLAKWFDSLQACIDQLTSETPADKIT